MKEVILDFLSSLEGYHQRLKEIHFSTLNKSEHLLADDMDGDVLEYQDRIAEASMGNRRPKDTCAFCKEHGRPCKGIAWRH